MGCEQSLAIVTPASIVIPANAGIHLPALHTA